MRSISISAVAGLVLLSALIVIPNVTAAAERTVNITDTTYVDKIVEIFPGDTVTWVNAGSQSHTITADNDSFTSGPLIPGARFSQKFMQPGFYPYHDTQNGASGGVGMSGVVRVVQQSTTPVQTVPAPVQTITTNTGATPSAATLYAQVLQLQQVLAALKAKAAAGTVTNIPTNTYTGPTGSAPCPRIGRVLKPGMSGDDVLRLQQFLAADASIYPDGSTTGYYGVLTQAAVQRWQIRNNIVATGDPETTGFGVVGPRTAAAMSLQCNTGGGPTGGTTPTLSGFIQVTPVMGTAPLVVSAQVTLNACQNTTYILDWGDGTNQTAIPFSANTCTSVQQTYAHTYAYGGQYAIKLAAGGHESSAVVVVDGPAKGATGTGATVSVLTITAPAAGLNLTAGQTVPISWQSNGTLPAGASIVFDLYTGAGEKVSESDVIAISSYASGSFSWTIPTPGGVCPAIYPGKLCGLTIPTGSYRIVAKAYQPSTSGNTFGALITEAASGIFTIIAAAGPGTGTGGTLVDTFTASVTSGQAPLSVNFTGKVTSANKGWCESGCFNFLQFGDGQGEFITLPSTAGASLGYAVAHTYQNSGTFVAKLYQSPDTSGPLVGSAITITVSGAPSNFVYGPLEVGQRPGDPSPLAVAATFDLPSACTGYKLTWGDGLADMTQAHSTSCARTPVTKTQVHTYGQGGSYTVTLLRGATLDKLDTVGMTIETTDVVNYNAGPSVNSCPVYTVQGCPTGQRAVYGSPSYDANGCSQPNYFCSVD